MTMQSVFFFYWTICYIILYIKGQLEYSYPHAALNLRVHFGFLIRSILSWYRSLTDLVSWVRCLPKGVGNFCIPICYLKICWRKWCFQRQVLKNLCATTVWLRFFPSWTITQTHTLLSPQRLFVKYQSQIHKVSRWLHKVCIYSSQCYYMR